MQLNLTSKLSCMIFVFFYCFYSSQNYNCISAYVLLHDASTLLSMVLMRFWALCPVLSVFRIGPCMLLSTTCRAPSQLVGLPWSCSPLLYGFGIHVTRQWAGCAKKQLLFFFFFFPRCIFGLSASTREGITLNACGCGGTVAAPI